MHSEEKLVRPLVQALEPYVPGEQPKIKGLIKLNTNENPFPPSPKVLAAVREAVDGRLRLYPNPTAEALRARLARFHGIDAGSIMVGNGSDEVLALAVRAFVEPAPPGMRHLLWGKFSVQYFTPSYSLYPVLAQIHGARPQPIPLNEHFGLPSMSELKRSRQWMFDAALTFVTTPNAPSGHGYSVAELRELCAAQKGVVVLDEAYVDFAEENAFSLATEFPNVLVARTFSKAYSLCFQRVGYVAGSPVLIGALQKIRDSYNVNGLGQIAAEATLDDLPYYRTNFKRIIKTRQMLSTELTKLGFRVFPSQTNFLLVRPPEFPAQEWLELLRAHKVLVRWFSQLEVRDYLRITIGTEEETLALITAVKSILKPKTR